jgi:hypothetical protein
LELCGVDADEPDEVQPQHKRQRLEDSFFGDMFSPSTVTRVNEVDLYLISVESDDNLLNFWRSKASQWPHLAKVAQMILAIPATETSSERVFSLAGRTLEDRRSRLNVETVDDLIFVHGLH